MSGEKIRVLVIDDSSIMRQLIVHLLDGDSELEVVGTAPDPYIGREKLIQLKPDLITLDLEMPRMDGLTFLRKIMKHMPTRTVVVSSLSQRGSELALQAYEAGAIDVIAKPVLDVVEGMKAMRTDLVSRVKAAARARFQPIVAARSATGAESRGAVRATPATVASAGFLKKTTHQVLAIGASTGGTEAIKAVLLGLPADLPGTVIVQHMPPMFTKTFATNLNKLCPFEVKEAEDGDQVRPGVVLLAPGNFHMELVRNGAKYHVALNQSPPIHGVRPSVDPLFESVARNAGKNSIGVILTGMGRDGAQGISSLQRSGGLTIAQDEHTCVVFGMPKEAIATGCVDHILPLHRIGTFLVEEFSRRAKDLGLSA